MSFFQFGSVLSIVVREERKREKERKRERKKEKERERTILFVTFNLPMTQ
jgi:hypothetical protein